MHGPDPTRVVRGFVVDVVPLLRRPGDSALVRLDEPLVDVAISAAAATAVRGELVVESMSDSLTVSGGLTVVYEGECRRCLEPSRGEIGVDVHEVFERHPVEGETYGLAGERLDLEPMVREVVLLHLPLAPLCDPGCRGPAPEVFPAEVESDDEPAEISDPRWAALADLVFDDTATDETATHDTATTDDAHPADGQ